MPYRYNPFTSNFDLVSEPGSGTATTQFDTDSGSASPDGDGIITVSGTNGITVSGAGSTVTIDGSTAGIQGPGSSTDNAVVRWDGTAGTAVQNSVVTISDTGNVASVQNLLMDTSPATPSTVEGSLFWDSTDHTLALKNDESDVTLQLGQENQIRVRNESGTLISNGEVVYISGTEAGGENRPLIALAQADTAATSSIIGIATHSIEDASYGYVTSFGLVRDVDTSAFTAGDQVYLSATVAGGLTNVEPVSPNFAKSIGYVVNSDASTGSLLVSIVPDTARPAGDATELTLTCRKDSAGTINAGEVVYQSGYNVGAGVVLVELADADNAATMPALGIARDTFTNSANGEVVISGLVVSQNTAAYSVGDALYVDTTAGALTNVRPTAATTQVQKIGNVARVNASTGAIVVQGAGRSNDIPNIMPDDYFRIVDDGDNTKAIQFQASGISGGTTRTITMPDNDVNLGNIAVNNGGTGLTSYTTNDMIYASGATTLTTLAAGTGILNTNGGAPNYATSLGFNFGTIGNVGGGNRLIFCANLINSAGSGALIRAQVAGTSAGDAALNWRINSGQEWTGGLDNDDGDSWVLAASSALGTTNVMRADTTGVINYPLQVAFHAYNSSTDANATGDGTPVTVEFDTETFDQNSDYNNTTDTFTAPVSGRYYLYFSVRLDDLSSGHTRMSAAIVTSNATFDRVECSPFALADNQSDLVVSGSVLADMDASDTATIRVTVFDSTLTVDITGAADAGVATHFGGWLVA